MSWIAVYTAFTDKIPWFHVYVHIGIQSIGGHNYEIFIHNMPCNHISANGENKVWEIMALYVKSWLVF